jgi:hypothetical protein
VDTAGTAGVVGVTGVVGSTGASGGAWRGVLKSHMMKNTSTTMPNDAAADKIDVVRLPLRLAAARLYRMLLLLLPLTLLLSSCFTGNTALRVVAMMDR